MVLGTGVSLSPARHLVEIRVSDEAVDTQEVGHLTGSAGAAWRLRCLCRMNWNLNRSLPRFDVGEIRSINLEQFRAYVSDIYTEFFWLDAGIEHYKLLAYLSTCYNDVTFIDVGTDKGCSALALSYNPSNRVISYDIENRRVGSIDLPNIEFRIGDAVEDRTELLSAPVIMLDTMHDGVFEQRVYRSLVEWRYEGLLLLDDIYLNPAMERFWSKLRLEKIDLTPLGHFSGTGLVRFDTAPQLALAA